MGWNKVGGLATVLAVAFALHGGRAEAQSCATMINNAISTINGGGNVYVSVASSQANKISTSVDRVKMGFDSVNSKLDSFVYPGNQAPMRFSDRDNATYSNQNFSTVSSQTEDVDVQIFISGGVAQARIQNLVWNFTITIPVLSCTDGMMFGFGATSPQIGWIGNGNGGQPAMFIFTFH